MPDGESYQVVFGIDIGAMNSSVSCLDTVGEHNVERVTFSNMTNYVPTRLYYSKKNPNADPVFDGSVEDKSAYNEVTNFKARMNKLSTLKEEGKRLLLKHYKDWLACLLRKVPGQYTDRDSTKRLVVMTVPNRWQLDQHAILKDAIVGAGWVASQVRDKNIKFIRECEATLHSFMKGSEWAANSSDLKVGSKFIVVDAGHVNCDVALYSVKSANTGSGWQFEEMPVHPPETVELSGIQQASDHRTTAEERKIDAIADKIRTIGSEAKVLFLADNNAQIAAGVREELQDDLELLKIVGVGRQNAADGAIYWYKKKVVVAHTSASSYGIEVDVRYIRGAPHMKDRKPGPGRLVPHGMSLILDGNSVMPVTTQQVRKQFFKEVPSRDPALLKFTVDVYAAERTADKNWIRNPYGKFNTGYREIVVIRADLSKLVDKLEEVEDDVEERYRIDFGVEMSFESANLVAHIIYNDAFYGYATVEPAN